MTALRSLAWIGGALSLGAQAAAPVPEDFASGISLALPDAAESYELELPLVVYQQLSRPDLADMRVFNARGEVVQHALCEPPVLSRRISRQQRLPHFGLPPGGEPAELLGPRLRLTTPEGARIDYREGPAASPARRKARLPDGREIEILAPQIAMQAVPVATPATASPEPADRQEAPQTGLQDYIVDARGLEEPVQALLLDWDWRGPQGRAELSLRVEGSHDLDEWQTLVERSSLLRAGADGRVLERSQIELPGRHYAFLRLRPLDQQPRDWLNGVEARSERLHREAPALRWHEASADPAGALGPSLRHYRNDSLAPVRAARLWPPSELLLQLQLSSRPDSGAAWRQRARGQIRRTGEQPPGSWTLSPAVQDPEWQVRIQQGGESLGDQPLRLELAYSPLRLRMLNQGPGPYLLAFGSARVGPTALPDCASLPGDPVPLSAGALQELGGEASLQPPPERLPVRTVLLWALLAGGALLVVSMALSLLRQASAGAPRS